MRVAQVCPRFFPNIGGVQTRVEEISKRLVKRGYEVEVLTTDPSGKLPKDDIINGVRVKRFKSWTPNQVYSFSGELKKYLLNNSNDYEIVHAHDYHNFPALYASQAKKKNKLVFTPHYHGKGNTFFRNMLHIPYKLAGKKIFERADRVICVSDYEKNLVMGKFNVKEKKIYVIPNGVSPEEFDCLKKRRRNCIVLCVARLDKYKGIEYLIEALPRLDDDVCLEIVGKGPDKRNLLKRINKLGLANRVKFYWDLPRRELLQLYVDAGVFVLLSKYEAFGICVAEALCSKTPCIVAISSALREWVDNKTCFGIDYPIDADKLAKLISEVIGRHISEVKLHTWDDSVKELNKLYEACVY